MEEKEGGFGLKPDFVVDISTETLRRSDNSAVLKCSVPLDVPLHLISPPF